LINADSWAWVMPEKWASVWVDILAFKWDRLKITILVDFVNFYQMIVSYTHVR